MQGKTGSLLNTAAELCEDGKFIEALKCYDKVLQIGSSFWVELVEQELYKPQLIQY